MLLETGLEYNDREWFLTDLHQNNQASVNLQKTKAELEGHLRIYQQDRNLTRSYIKDLAPSQNI